MKLLPHCYAILLYDWNILSILQYIGAIKGLELKDIPALLDRPLKYQWYLKSSKVDKVFISVLSYNKRDNENIMSEFLVLQEYQHEFRAP